MNFSFDQIINRRASDSVKWNYYDDQVLPLWVADMDFLSPPSVSESLINRINHGVFGYSKTQDASKIAVQHWMEEQHGWSIDKEHILLIPEVVQAFNIAAIAYTNPGDSILFHTPAYHPFYNVSKNANLTQIVNPLSPNKSGHYSLDFEGLENSIQPRTRIFMLCNPHNPTGRVFTAEELERLAQICLDHNLIICSDEIHSDIVFSEFKHTPTSSLSSQIADKTITLVSTTKTFNLAGLKSSAVIISNPHLREIYTKQLTGTVGSVNIFGELALTSAYQTGSAWLSSLLKYLENNRQLISDFISDELPELSFSQPEGTYLAWLNCSRADLENPGEFFLTKAQVALNPGEWFGENYHQFVRLNFGCPKDVLMLGLEKMKSALRSR